MSKYGTVTFTGASGSKYEFDAYPISTEFNSGGAIYFITKRTVSNGKASHTRIYVGQTKDISERFDDHHKQDCFDKHGANCICVHGDSNESSRLKKESDLIENYDPPCNG